MYARKVRTDLLEHPLLEHPLVGRSAHGSALGCAYVILAVLILGLSALGIASSNLVMIVFLSSLVVPLIYGILNGGPALAFVTALPILVAWLPTQTQMGELAILLLPGFTGAALGLYSNGVQASGRYRPAPHPGYKTNLMFITGALLITVAGLVIAGAIRPLALLALDPPMDVGTVDTVSLLGVLIALPVVGVVITLAYWIVWTRK